MAYITKVSGGSQPVFATDVLNGPVAQGANIAAQGPVNFAGPKLDFFSVVANASLAAQGGVNGYVANVIQAVQQTATVAIVKLVQQQVKSILPCSQQVHTLQLLLLLHAKQPTLQLVSQQVTYPTLQHLQVWFPNRFRFVNTLNPLRRVFC